MTIQLPFDFATLPIPSGFRWGTAQAAIKTQGRPDVGILTSDVPCAAAATFTQNAFAAAPVHYSKANLAQTKAQMQCVVVNSGCANAATGEQGFSNAVLMADLTAKTIGCHTEQVFVCSTGTIGVQLPMDKMTIGINAASKDLGHDVSHFEAFARAIMTTDTVPKAAGLAVTMHDGREIKLLGCCKGSGMIHPMMATMLGYVVTDAAIDPQFLQEMFSRCVERSFNCVTVDGDTSTNDTAIILASGASQCHINHGTADALIFEQALLDVMQSLGKQMARDGEGATKLIEIQVQKARSFEEARVIGHQIANSPLVKTAIYGHDANWGRIACAVGNAPIDVDSSLVNIKLGNIELLASGQPVPFDEALALEVLKQDTVIINVTLGLGTKEATVWTCDFTEKYIEINGCYRT